MLGKSLKNRSQDMVPFLIEISTLPLIIGEIGCALQREMVKKQISSVKVFFKIIRIRLIAQIYLSCDI